MAVSLNGLTKLPKNISKYHHCGHLTKDTMFVRDMNREVCGFPPYEWWAMELLKVSKIREPLTKKEREEVSTLGSGRGKRREREKERERRDRKRQRETDPQKNLSKSH
uniref:Large ribosomal subunit protein eL36 n=1 Tax=Sarcophilus harrisii TaxID=9305 RepID=A0A7N4NFX0_SARHA